ncbi:MAG: hypothetical protein H6R19_2430 [Proteobacteria bacterium]|nr:hypothetical protein [Pseudomonadota bacterium]
MTTILLSDTHPDFWHDALNYPIGLHVVTVPGELLPLFLMKMPHQFLLAARMNRGVKVYAVPIEVNGDSTLGLMTVFLDDADSPLMLWTPLALDSTSHMLIQTLLAGTFTIRLFDEHNRELLGYLGVAETPLRSRVRLEHVKLYSLTHELAHRWKDAGHSWFSLRTIEDDADAVTVRFETPLYPEDRVFKDERPDLYRFHGTKGFSEVPLVKLEPGQFQEVDIILLLQRIFSPEQIYHAPKRHYDGEEIADVVVITDNLCLIVQAKDSPNTEQMLNNSLKRKRRKSVKQLDEGCTQIGGAINYLDRTRPLVMRIDGRDEVVDLGRRNVLSLVVVREFFLDMYDVYSKRLLQLHAQTGLPCIALDYGELIEYATFCDSEPLFVNAYFQVFNAALDGGTYPRLRFGVRDLFRPDGSFRFS